MISVKKWKFVWKKRGKKSFFIPAGNRTRILCLEGKYRNHLTTRMHLSVCSEKDVRHGEALRRNMTRGWPD